MARKIPNEPDEAETHVIQIAIGDVQARLIRRKRHAVGVRARILPQRRRHCARASGRRSDYRDALEYRVHGGMRRVDVDYLHRVRLVFGDIEKRLRFVQRHLVGPAFYVDSRGYQRRLAEIHDVDFAAANARDISCIRWAKRSSTGHNHPERTFATRSSRHCRGGSLAGTEVNIRHEARRRRLPVAVSSGEHRDRTVYTSVLGTYVRLAAAALFTVRFSLAVVLPPELDAVTV